MGRPYAYLRKSSVRDDTRDTSYETQEREVRALAARHGDSIADDAMLVDWNISGRRQYTAKRTGYQALLRAIESAECSAVYSYSLSRLGRSASVLARLFDDCADKKVPIRLVADGIDTSSATGRMTAGVLAQMAQLEAELASERVLASYATRRQRAIDAGLDPREAVRCSRRYGERRRTVNGEDRGEGEDLSLVLAAFDKAGSYSGAARLLNAQGVKPRMAEKWWANSVRVIVHRERPETAKGKPTRGGNGLAPFRLARLLYCGTCGHVLTGSNLRQKNGTRRTRYACRFAESSPHPKVAIDEARILPAIQREVALLRTPEEIEEETGDEEARKELEARKERVVQLFEDGDIDRPEKARRLERVNEELERLDKRRALFDFPEIDWTWDPDLINRALRVVFDRIDLDPVTFLPVRFEWTAPEWRAERHLEVVK